MTAANDRWWIVDPIGHRIAEAKEPKPETTTFLGQEVPVIYPTATFPPDLWVCDLCNLDIPVVVDGVTQIVPMYGSYALCQTCLVSHLPGGQEQVDAWRNKTWKPSMWSTSACACVACVAAATVIQAEVEIGT